MTREKLLVGLVFLFAGACGGKAVEDSDTPEGPRCEVDGKSYRVGEPVPGPDGCNTCTCEVGGLACTQIGCIAGCRYNGSTYPFGATFPAGDGCNSCSCGSDGVVGCTLIGCAPVECVYLGRTYKAGEGFPARDGCNQCQCENDGSISCTERGCPCDPGSEWWREYVIDDSRICESGQFGCTNPLTLFYSACGCGCEQDPSCPRYIDCTTADCKRCPRSYPLH